MSSEVFIGGIVVLAFICLIAFLAHAGIGFHNLRSFVVVIVIFAALAFSWIFLYRYFNDYGLVTVCVILAASVSMNVVTVLKIMKKPRR